MPSRVPADMVEKRGVAASQVIIQCPSCQTKFALDREYLGGIDNPKFHCSRCDHVFRPDLEMIASTALPSTKLGPKMVPVTPESRSAKSGTPPNNRLHPERIVTQDTTSPFRDDEEVPTSRTRPARDTDFEYEDLESNEAALKPSDFSISTSSYAPRTEKSADEAPPSQVSSKDFVVHEPATTPEVKAIPKISTKAVSSATSKASDFERDFSIGAPVPPAGSVLPSQIPVVEPRANRQERVVPGMSLFRSMRRMANGWHGPLLYLAPVAAVMTGLVLLTTSARLNPERVSGLVTSVVPSILEPAQPKVPPSGVYVKQSQLKLVTLQDGNKVPLLVGRVVNSTNSQISGVTVEGIGFDRTARAVVSRRAPIRSELAREKPEFLTKETVARLEGIAPLRRQILEPGEAAEFAVVLESGAEQESISYYSARIFSVQ